MIAVAEKLGVGLYTPSEAAYYARVPVQTLNRWFFGNKQGGRVARPHFEDESRTITFLDFAQALAIRNLRVNHKVPVPKIREAIERASEGFQVSYPLARERSIYLFGNELYINLKREEFDPRKLTGANRDQRMLPIVEIFMRDMGFDAEGLAIRYTAFRYSTTEVSIDPEIRLGEPFLRSCGYSARTLWEACEAEGSIEAAAAMFEVSVTEVEAAYRYFDYLSAA